MRLADTILEDIAFRALSGVKSLAKGGKEAFMNVCDCLRGGNNIL